MSDSDSSDDDLPISSLRSPVHPDSNGKLERLDNTYLEGYRLLTMWMLRNNVSPRGRDLCSWRICGSHVLTTSDEWRSAGRIFARHPCIGTFELDSNEFSQESFQVFMAALKVNKTIRNITIRRNPHVGTKEGSLVLSAFLSRMKCPVECLCLDSLGISLGSFETLAPAIGRSGVAELCLTGNDLSVNTEEKCETLCRIMTNNLSGLLKLDIAGCNLGKTGCTAVANFVQSSSLTSISLENNNLNDECCEILARSFMNKKSVRKILLSDNDDIALAGLGKFAWLLVGTHTISSIEDSNHDVLVYHRKLLPKTIYNGKYGGSSHLALLLMINSTATYSEREKIRAKIFLMRQYPQTLLSLMSIDIKLLSRVVERYYDRDTTPSLLLYVIHRGTTLSLLFRVIRQMAPEIFGRISTKRLRRKDVFQRRGCVTRRGASRDCSGSRTKTTRSRQNMKG